MERHQRRDREEREVCRDTDRETGEHAAKLRNAVAESEREDRDGGAEEQHVAVATHAEQ